MRGREAERAGRCIAADGRSAVPSVPLRTRRAWIRDVVGAGVASAAASCLARAEGGQDLCRDDVSVNATTALLYSAKAPLVPGEGLRDARAVWSCVSRQPERSVLVFLHGHNGYVTVDGSGRSRVPDWASNDKAAHAGASAKKAAPLVYALDRLGAEPGPVVLAPEVSTLATGAFWAKEPAGQYADSARLGALVGDCIDHLACLRRGDGDRQAYLPAGFPGGRLDRVYLGGHSGAGLPLEEAAASDLILPETGVPADLWLFDCTYWSAVARFVRFCAAWNRAGRLGGGRRDAARFVCIYRPETQTEEIADALRAEIANILGESARSLVIDHAADTLESRVRPALERSGALFIRTDQSHDAIPTYFIPELLRTAPRRG